MTPFAATLRSEWYKLTSLRSTKLLLSLAVVLGVLLTGLVAWAAGATFDKWDAAGRSEFEPIASAMIGAILSAILLLVLAVKAATAEYGSGLIRLTLTATPRRARVLGAKAAVVAALSLGAGLAGTAAMFVLAQAIFASYGMPSSSLADPDALRAVVGNGLLAAQFPVMAMALGIMLRSTSGAVLGVFAMIFGPPFLGGLLPAWYGDHVVQYLPGAASDAIAMGHLEGMPDGLPPAIAALVVIAWLAVFLGGARLALERRDA